jgi:DNA polymerase-4
MEQQPLQRKIIHIDMDAFYASVEQMDNPELKGKPLAVGGSEVRGVVSAASYEARKFGVRSAISGIQAKKLCPDLIFVRPRFDRYKEISKKIRKIFLDYTDLVEPLSLDEAYLDVTENKKGNPSATLIAQEIRKRIFEEVGLTASAGISVNKFVAKIASDYNKPNGQKTVNPDEVEAFLEKLDVKKFYGSRQSNGRKNVPIRHFHRLRFKAKTVRIFRKTLWKNSGLHYYQIVRGIHNSAVKPNRKIKSVGAERTFGENLSSEIFMEERLLSIAKELEKRLQKSKIFRKNHHIKNKILRFHPTNPKQNFALFCKRQKHHFRRCQRFTLSRAFEKLRSIARHFHPQLKQRRKNQNRFASKKCFGAIEV